MTFNPAKRRPLRGLLPILGLLLLGATAAWAVDWVELGPAPITNGDYTGRVSAVVCSPSDPNRFFVAGADGGVWRTTDGGVSWTPLTDHMPTTALGALALDPTDENVVYAGTGEANYANHSRYGLGLFKSADGGNTWTQLAEETFGGRCFSRIVINPPSPQTMYAAITRAGGFPELAAAKGHPGATGLLGIFRSLDAGVSWTQLGNGLPNLSATDLAMDPANPNVLYAAIGRIFGALENGIYKSTDGGDSWSKLSGGLPTGTLGRISVAVAPSMPARVYALITNPCDAFGGGAATLGAYRSNDGGGSWTSLPLGNIQSSYGWYLSFVSVQPTNPDVVFMGGLSLHRSTNAGSSWATVTPPHVDMHGAAWDASGRLVVGDDGGVHRSDNLGSSWYSLNDGLGIIQFYAGLSAHPTGISTFLGGTQDNGSNKRVAETVNWTQVFGGDGGWTQIDQISPVRMFVEYQGTGNIYRSTNGGSSFNYSGSGISSGDRNCFLPPYLIDPTDSNRMIYGTHRVYRSTNGGTSWSPISGDLSDGSGAIRALAMAPTDPDIVYAATNDGNVQVSTDGGSTFTLIRDSVPGWPRVTREVFVDPTDAQTAYLAVASFDQIQIQRTRDAGQNWEALDVTLPNVPVNVVAVDVRGVKPVIYAGADHGVYRSINDGAAWHRYGSGLPNAVVVDMVLEPDRARLVVSTQGRGAWRIPIAIPGDLNGDGVFNGFDIDAFTLALADPDAYAQQYPNIDPNLVGDMNGDGQLNGFDIDGFVALLES
ncbi:MAG: hypothetical protein KKB50_18910 [Planctomycetes bacterium]|nr:hypothetical protein [Planctomycetota bacterium]